ncbi:hypothetical protein BGZ99_008716 [Dissophora globulifera]|uniref:FAD-binding domain-containing protein n=1 Tax=Dissophora globulifera TaxID=979702 RepID=A0A9P6RAN5_9FUNG|nr:hypothetical protein BGZ99_008716 [Dissophora globulifera]
MECSPKVLIVGAGIGGLFLGILLERAGIEYEIFERAAQIKPLGSVLVSGPTILPVFEQLGLLDEIEKISKPLRCLNIYNSNQEKLGSMETNTKERAGYYSMVFARQNLHFLLLSQIPAHKIHMNKNVTTIHDIDEGVQISCSDNSTYVGDILVGADGAYSGVRQNLYKKLVQEKMLPKCDQDDLSTNYICLVGTTDALDPEKHPYLANEFSHFEAVLANDSSESVTCVTIPDNKICWVYTMQISSTSANETLKNSEWGSEAASSMCDKIRHVKAPFGLTMGNLIDLTPRKLISKVMLEEKLFETWYHERTVLLGDACHKMLPSVGQGAINAMQDATILANCINQIKSLTVPNIAAALKDYRDQRYQFAKTQFETSHKFAFIMGGQSWREALLRKLVLNFMPKSLNQRRQDRTCAYRPQVNFMNQVPVKGIIPVLPQVAPKQYGVETKVM